MGVRLAGDVPAVVVRGSKGLISGRVPDVLGDVLGWIRHTAVPGPPARRRPATPRHSAVLDPLVDARSISGPTL